ncbi:MAG: hypothetical protein M0T80_01245 [Actinomycetota bacterium]|nr:hypothetical protein [Actinomycetota bacterium]
MALHVGWGECRPAPLVRSVAGALGLAAELRGVAAELRGVAAELRGVAAQPGWGRVDGV